ncbi:hypothetical protein GCM10027051_12520 [Niabella terrae]
MTLLSCGYPKNFSTNFFDHNASALNSVCERYEKLYNDKPFTVLFENRTFTEIAFEIITPKIKYIYHFNIDAPAFGDSLDKYHFDRPAVLRLIRDLKSIGCTWITRLNYFEQYQKKYMILMAVRNQALNSTFKGESYCLLTFFNSPQVFDKKGRIVDKYERSLKKQVNGYPLYRLNDSVGYSIAKKYR